MILVDAETRKKFTKIRRVQFPQFFFKLEAVFDIKAREKHMGRVLAFGAYINLASPPPTLAPSFPPPWRRVASSQETCFE